MYEHKYADVIFFSNSAKYNIIILLILQPYRI